MEKDQVELLDKNDEVIPLSTTIDDFDETEFIGDLSTKATNSAWKDTSNGQEEKEKTLFDSKHGRVTVESASKSNTPTPSKKERLPSISKIISPRSIVDENQQIVTDDVKSLDRKQHLEEPKSSRRQSVGDWSIDSGRSLTSQSDSRSYRERLRDRFQNKDRPTGGTSVASSQSSFWQRRLKQKSPVVSKYDDFFRKEEEEISAALEKHQEMRVKWQKMYHLSSEAEESYNFFTKVWDEEVEEVKGEKPKMSPPAGDEVETEEQTKLLASDFLGLPHEGSSVLEPYVLPQVEDINMQLQFEDELYFYPTNDPVPLEDKIDGEAPIRRLEEEGLFVGDPPPIPLSWQNRLEQRLLVAGDKHWFGNDGRLKTLSDPLLSTAFHPPLYNAKLNPALKLKYKPAAVFDMTEKRNSLEKVPDDRPCLLELEVGALSFTHHPLFTREFVLAQSIVSMFEAYRERLDSEVGLRLAQRLMALRLARDNLIRAAATASPSRQAVQAEKLKKYSVEIRRLRDSRLSEGSADRSLTARLLRAWHDLKQLRERQRFVSTKVCLQIYTPENGASPFSLPNEMENEIRNQVAELEAEAWEEYNQKMEEYKQKWNEWKRESKTKNNSDQEPDPPLKPDLQNLESEVTKLVSDCIRPPDEPAIVLQLTEETPTMDISDTTEQQRRSLVKRCQIALRILYNGQEVCQTLPQSLDQTFKVTFNQLFAIRILHWPQTFSIELIMDGKRNVAEIFVPIPPSGMTLDSASVEQLVFSSARVVRPLGVGAVGAGVEFSILPGGAPLCPYTSGVITCRAGWGREDGLVLCPPDKYLPANVKSRNKVAPALNLIKDISKLKEWADKTQLDPNDPTNADFFESLKAASQEVTHVKEPLLNPLVAQFEFCTDEELENNPRLKLLRLRDQATPEFRGVRCIPLREREIPPDIFKIYEKRLSTASTPLKQVETMGVGGGGSIEAHRAFGVVFLAKVKDNLVRRFRQARHQRALRDIVIEDQVPDMGTLGLTFMKWLQPKRPLRPQRKERTKVPVKSLAGHEVKIIVNVVRAFEVPVRADVDPGVPPVGTGGGPGVPGGSPAMVPVRPFVEISFQGQRCRTTTAEGANPTWNQDLHIPLKAPNGDMTPGGLQSIRDNLYCHLYDETVIDLLEDDRQRTTNIHQRMERHWLGSLAIPFASLYANSRVEGTFKLYSPPVLLGYERDSHHRHGAVGSANNSGSPHLRHNTFLTLFITVHPPLHLPEPFKERLECSEPPHLEQYMEEWEAQVKRDFPNRSVKSTVMDLNGKSVCVTRFFRPLEPPVLEDGVVTTPEMAAWFVSKIPSTPGSILFPGLFDIWLTADQVLKVLQGDSDDLAILLCCFFLRLGLRAWLALGVGIPHGRSSFVLTCGGGGVTGGGEGTEQQQQHQQQWHVWDPSTGQKYALTDSFCPLHRVHCLINDDNVWMNVQKEDLLRRVRLDVGRRGDWLGLFARGAAAAAVATSLQPQQLDLAPTSKQDAQVLQDRIEKLLRDSIAKWRPTARTVWNRYCIVTLRKLLPSLEKASWSNEQTSTILQEHLQELNHILSSHKMCGFPLNFAYTKIDDIEEAVKGTGVHCYESLDVEFALAVYVHPYPCDILSVWVYVASLVRRR